MSSYGESTLSGDPNSKKPKGVEAVSSPRPIKPIGKSGVSSGLTIGDPNSKKVKGEAAVSSSSATKPIGQTGVSFGLSIGDPHSKKPNVDGNSTISSASPMIHTAKTGFSSGVRGKAAVSSGVRGKAIVSNNVGEVMSFRDVTFGPHEGEVRFRLIHFWEARNAQMKVVIGLEMLFINEEETVVQGFIPPGRIETYLSHMKAGAIYRLNKFFGSKNKTLYRVAEPSVTITFSWNSVISVLEDSSVCFPEDWFRFHGYEEFEAACDLKGDLYDYVGHIKLVNGQVLNDSLLLDEAEIASTRRVLLHVQTHDGPVMKLYLWDKAASDFSEKFKASGSTASVILVTTLNPKRFGCALSLSSITPSRVFMDSDVQATRDYLSCLNSNLDVAKRVNAEVVTKTETVAWFECTSTIDDVVHGSGWYYIGCGECHTKATKGPTTLMCNKCGKSEIVGVAQYLSKISVYDNNDPAVFVLLGDAGQELTGKNELVESYYEANESVGDDHIVPMPQALIDTIGQTRKFIVKVSKYNLTGKTQSLTVTKVLPPEAVEPVLELEEDVIVPDSQETLQIGVAEDGPSTGFRESVGEREKRAADMVEAKEPKRAKCG
ncbi:hypothetical protein F2Q69_00048952 [Brassica cretica]|uniref:Replication factor A C-terminal domain-containing protein n=1 Tax=Brassica cretica TaxID=69181 RepID=A0A8S9PL42_BRACR|nr:hypothetical protein F2Q69_00048952 [Brassica cretica]